LPSNFYIDAAEDDTEPPLLTSLEPRATLKARDWVTPLLVELVDEVAVGEVEVLAVADAGRCRRGGLGFPCRRRR
jgi:hypothetical protein